MSVVTDLAAWLGEQDLGTWKATGSYSLTDEWPIFILARPASPDRIISLSPYVVEQSSDLSDGIVGMQVRVRGTSNPNQALDKAAAVFNALQNLTHEQVGETHVVQVLLQSGTPLGADTKGRWEQSDNYYIWVHQPTKNRS